MPVIHWAIYYFALNNGNRVRLVDEHLIFVIPAYDLGVFYIVQYIQKLFLCNFQVPDIEQLIFLNNE